VRAARDWVRGMGCSRDADEVYRLFAGMLEIIGADEALGIAKADTVVRNRYADPHAVITITLRPDLAEA
jgi:hypothetical protein